VVLAVLVDPGALVVLVVSVVLVVLVNPGVWAVQVASVVQAVPATRGNTIRPTEVVLLMVIAIPQTNSAAPHEVIRYRTDSAPHKETSDGKEEILAAPRDQAVLVIAAELRIVPGARE